MSIGCMFIGCLCAPAAISGGRMTQSKQALSIGFALRLIENVSNCVLGKSIIWFETDARFAPVCRSIVIKSKQMHLLMSWASLG